MHVAAQKQKSGIGWLVADMYVLHYVDLLYWFYCMYFTVLLLRINIIRKKKTCRRDANKNINSAIKISYYSLVRDLARGTKNISNM
jgi:hypothetical protein